MLLSALWTYCQYYLETHLVGPYELEVMDRSVIVQTELRVTPKWYTRRYLFFSEKYTQMAA